MPNEIQTCEYNETKEMITQIMNLQNKENAFFVLWQCKTASLPMNSTNIKKPGIHIHCIPSVFFKCYVTSGHGW